MAPDRLDSYLNILFRRYQDHMCCCRIYLGNQACTDIVHHWDINNFTIKSTCILNLNKSVFGFYSIYCFKSIFISHLNGVSLVGQKGP